MTAGSFLMTSAAAGAAVSLRGAELAGKRPSGDGDARLLVRGAGVMLVHLRLRQGFDQNGHTHPDHESVGYVVSGRIRMRIGDRTHLLGPGDTWYHPKGVEHTSEALEDSEVLEFHAPLREDLCALLA